MRNLAVMHIVAVLFLCAAQQTAFAQGQSRIEISGAYQAVPDSSLSESGMRRESGARGWSLDAALPLTRRLSLVGAVDGSYGHQTEATSSFGGGTVRSSWTDVGYWGGVRFHFPSSSRVAPFAQVLGGVLSSRNEVEYETARSSASFAETVQPVLLNLGAGVNAMITRRFGVRVGGDVRLDLAGAALRGDDTTLARIFGGVVIAIQ